ncbi:MAG: hypothetical protein WCR42_07230 [bacterium]
MNLLTIIIYAEDSKQVNDSIKSIYKFADQIIVISNDKGTDYLDTVEVIYLQINIHQSKAHNLNTALKLSNAKWILYLNSGDRLSTSETFNIRDLISSAKSNCGGFICRMNDAHNMNDSGSSSGFYPRLFLKDSSNDHFFKGIIFEQSTFGILESGKSIYPSDITIFQTDTNEQTKELDSITFLKQVDIDSQNEYYWYELGLIYTHISDLTQAEEAFINVFDYDAGGFYIKEITSLALSNICRRTKRFEEAILWSEMAYDFAKDKTYALQALANAYLWKQDTEKAKKYFDKIDKVIHEETYKYYYTTFPQVVVDDGLEQIAKLESSNLL